MRSGERRRLGRLLTSMPTLAILEAGLHIEPGSSNGQRFAGRFRQRPGDGSCADFSYLGAAVGSGDAALLAHADGGGVEACRLRFASALA